MKKRILLVTSGGLGRSGVPSVIMTIVRGLKDECAFDIMLSAPEDDAYLPEFKSYGGEVFVYRKKRFHLRWLNTLADFARPFSLFFRTRQVIARNASYDAVHCFNEFDMAGSLAAAAVKTIPIRIGHVHKTWMNRGGPLTRLYRWYCRRLIDRCATCRLGCSRLACDCFYSAKTDARVLNNPYDETRFHPSPDAIADRRPVRMIQVGYLCDNKNQRFTLEVFRTVAARCPDAEMTFVGAGGNQYEESLRADVRAAGLESRVTFLPPDTDLPLLMSKSTLLMLPSKSEGFGMVLIEAQAMGLFCYASDTVPKETDLGSVRFLPLSDGPESWANTILQERLFLQKIPRDCSAFSAAGFTQSVRQLYEVSKETQIKENHTAGIY